MLNKVKERFFVIPLVFSVIFLFLYYFFHQASLFQFINENFIQEAYDQFLGSAKNYIGYSTFVVIFGYFYGYTYGTISRIIRIRDFRGTFRLALFAIKLSVVFFILPLGLMMFIIDLFSLPLVFRLNKKKEEKKKEELKQIMREAVREEVRSHINNNNLGSQS